jgi:uncharacterized SAM-binding protein YcdF (DUF218 family)
MNQRRKRMLFQLAFIYLPLVCFLYVLVLFALIRQTAGRDEAQPADIIIVFGAAQYNGRPSPVFKARLDHTALLFKRNLAQKIMTTGGHGVDSRFTEAEVGKEYLTRQNIPLECIFVEPSSLTTLESVQRFLEFLRLQNLNRVIAVSDGFHLFRIKRIFQDHHVTVFGSPARNSPIESSLRSRVWASLREVFVYTAYLAQKKLNLPIPYEALGPKE